MKAIEDAYSEIYDCKLKKKDKFLWELEYEDTTYHFQTKDFQTVIRWIDTYIDIHTSSEFANLLISQVIFKVVNGEPTPIAKDEFDSRISHGLFVVRTAKVLHGLATLG